LIVLPVSAGNCHALGTKKENIVEIAAGNPDLSILVAAVEVR